MCSLRRSVPRLDCSSTNANHCILQALSFLNTERPASCFLGLEIAENKPKRFSLSYAPSAGSRFESDAVQFLCQKLLPFSVGKLPAISSNFLTIIDANRLRIDSAAGLKAKSLHELELCMTLANKLSVF